MSLRSPVRWRLGALGAVLALAGCFQQFEEFRQLEAPARPPGAESVPPGPLGAVFPLVVGTRYDYQAHFGLGAAGPFYGTASLSVIDAWARAGRETDVVQVRSTYFGRSRLDPYLFVRTPDWIGLTEKAPPDKVTFFMPTRLPLGARWKVETGEGTGSAAIEAIEDVRVPAGRFAGCQRLHYLNPARATEITLWLAPHVGLVQADVRLRVNVLPLAGRLELTHWAPPLDLNAPAD